MQTIQIENNYDVFLCMMAIITCVYNYNSVMSAVFIGGSYTGLLCVEHHLLIKHNFKLH